MEDFLSIKFHFRGYFLHDGREWQYVGGRHGMSTVRQSKLSLDELKIHLSQHVACSKWALKEATLHWKFPGLIRDGVMSSTLLMLHDRRSVLEMATHASDAGVMDIYCNIPADFSDGEEQQKHVNSEEQKQIANAEVQQQQFTNAEKQQQFGNAEGQQQQFINAEEQQQFGNAEGQQQFGNLEEHHQSTSAEEQPKQEPEPWQCANLYYQPGRTSKLPVSRGKLVVDEEEVNTSSDESDSDYVIPPTESNSSASDDEVQELRKYAKELKDQVKKKMSREDECKPCNVPDAFIVPETFKLDDSDGEGTPYFESDDDMSYDEASDGEVNEVRRRKTSHRVYDDTTEKPEFAVGMAFTDSREFKQALVKYGLANFHHLRFPKDEKKRVSAECTWPGCPWSIYGSIGSRSDWLLVVRYNNVHTCIPRRDNKLVTSTVIAKKYFRYIRHNPTWHVEHMQEAVLEDLLADVSLSKCKRAKKISHGKAH